MRNLARRRSQPSTPVTSGRWGYLRDRGRWLVLLELDAPLAADLFRSLRWTPLWSEGGRGWLVERSYVGAVGRSARRLGITLYSIEDRADALSEVGA